MEEQLSDTPAFAPVEPPLKREPSNFEATHNENETAKFSEAHETEARPVETLGDI